VECCLCSLAKALNIAIRVIATLDFNNKVSAMTRDYVDGITSNSFITVGYNKASEHYVGIGQGRRVPHTQTQAVPTNCLMEQRIQRVQDAPVVERRPLSQIQRVPRTHAHVAIHFQCVA